MLELRRVSVNLKRRALRLGERVLLVPLAPPFVLSTPRLQTHSERSNVARAAFAAAATGGTRDAATSSQSQTATAAGAAKRTPQRRSNSTLWEMDTGTAISYSVHPTKHQEVLNQSTGPTREGDRKPLDPS